MSATGGIAKRVLILGGGYCGLAAAMELAKSGTPTVLVEKGLELGGLSRTITVGDTNFELGPHIYFDKEPEVTSFWRGLVGDGLRPYERNSRLFYAGRYIHSPLSVADTLIKLGPVVVARILLSFGWSKLAPRRIDNAEDWVVGNFGRELYERFFRVYNEKIWGLPSKEVAPDWAGQRIRSSLLTMLYKSVTRDRNFIVKTFDFPDGGSRSIIQAQESALRRSTSTRLRLGTSVDSVRSTGEGFAVRFSDGSVEPFSDVLSTIHLADLIAIVDFEGKDGGRLASLTERLMYRNLVLANLVFEANDFRTMHEHWIDIHDPGVTALRVTNFSGYRLNPRADKVAVGVEYNCSDGDHIWTSSDDAMLQLAGRDLRSMRLTAKDPIASSIVRIERAYPVYFRGYREVIDGIRKELSRVPGLQLAGRNAMYKWNNMHHSVKTGMLAARNILGERNDLTTVAGNVTIGKDSD
jgi:protoporphyrinogen oxidase